MQPTDFRFNQAPSERGFIALCEAYAASGGVASGEDLARLVDGGTSAQAGTSLAQRIADKDLFYFEWRGASWIPMVQLHQDDMSINFPIRQVRRELGNLIDGWEAALWFVSPNDWLRQRRPLDLMNRDLHAVLQAARADRFVAIG